MPDSFHTTLASLIARLDGRATGLWLRVGETLELAAFRPAPDLPASVRDGFVAATRVVPLSARELSIVRACLEGEPVLAVAEALPPDVGSGYWLRAFGAASSLAVPVVGRQAHRTGVLSVATRRVPGAPEELAAELRAAGATLLD